MSGWSVSVSVHCGSYPQKKRCSSNLIKPVLARQAADHWPKSPALKLCFYFYFCVCVCLHEGTCTQGGHGRPSLPPLSLGLIPLRLCLSLYLEVSWQPVSQSGPPVSTSHRAGVADACDMGPGDLNSGLQTQVLRLRTSYPAGTLTLSHVVASIICDFFILPFVFRLCPA